VHGIFEECYTHGGEEKGYKNLVGNPEGERLLEDPRIVWRIILK
jgi:hypothetical protein